jgi:proteic killer suppression protein
MIKSFGDKETKLVFEQVISKKFPADIQKRALIKLLLIDAADSEIDLKAPPSNNLEKLKGNLKNFRSIRINDKWRICFKFENGNAYDVSIKDYH